MRGDLTVTPLVSIRVCDASSRLQKSVLSLARKAHHIYRFALSGAEGFLQSLAGRAENRAAAFRPAVFPQQAFFQKLVEDIGR